MTSDAYYTAHRDLSNELAAAMFTLDPAAVSAIAAEAARLPPPGELETMLDYVGVHPNGWTYSSAVQTATQLRQRLARLASGSASGTTGTQTTAKPPVRGVSSPLAPASDISTPSALSGADAGLSGGIVTGATAPRESAMSAGKLPSPMTLGLIGAGVALAAWLLWRK